MREHHSAGSSSGTRLLRYECSNWAILESTQSVLGCVCIPRNVLLPRARKELVMNGRHRVQVRHRYKYCCQPSPAAPRAGTGRPAALQPAKLGQAAHPAGPSCWPSRLELPQTRRHEAATSKCTSRQTLSRPADLPSSSLRFPISLLSTPSLSSPAPFM